MGRRRVAAAVVALAPLLMLLLLLSRCSAAAARHGGKGWDWEEEREGEWRPEEEEEGGKGGGGVDPGPKPRPAERGLFVLDRGEKRGWSAASGCCREGLMHIGFITMEPKTLFVPQYVDSNLILFVELGEVKVGWMHKDELVEKNLKMGDVLHIDAGSTFYMVNSGKGQRLKIICSIDASDNIGFSPYQAFFLGGGGGGARHPQSVLAGFDPKTLVTALNTTYEDLEQTLLVETGRGPIMYYTTEPVSGGQGDVGVGYRGAAAAAAAGQWRPVGRGEEEDKEEELVVDEPSSTWSWRKLVGRLLGVVGGGAPSNSVAAKPKKKKDKTVRAPEPYNLYEHGTGFHNAYGSSVAVDKHDYEPLGHSDIGVYLVNLSAGSMMAPHVNPRATEYGVVLSGTGCIEVVFPNGSKAMSATVRAGDVFYIPRYFPFCQVASRRGPFVFFGFTTSARRNHPQFLVGASSVLRALLGPELAAAFGVPEKAMRKLVLAQNEAVILPSWPEKKKKWEEPEDERREEKAAGKQRKPWVIEQVAK
uniref:Cupin type-1 domain-containing protein n=1 Tax=Oryza punctata TaxID=4537 RepID=A0A0E0KDF3_ORYPU